MRSSGCASWAAAQPNGASREHPSSPAGACARSQPASGRRRSGARPRRIADGLPFDYLTRRRGIHHGIATASAGTRPALGNGRVGCIVAPVVSHLTGYTVGIWRIRPVMEGKVERRGIGPDEGQLLSTWWPEGDELGIAEGIEDALAVHQLTGCRAGRRCRPASWPSCAGSRRGSARSRSSPMRTM